MLRELRANVIYIIWYVVIINEVKVFLHFNLHFNLTVTYSDLEVTKQRSWSLFRNLRICQNSQFHRFQNWWKCLVANERLSRQWFRTSCFGSWTDAPFLRNLQLQWPVNDLIPLEWESITELVCCGRYSSLVRTREMKS